MNDLIKGMDMPLFCVSGREMCEIARPYAFCHCINDKVINYNQSRHLDCPLVEIPTPHGRLIDADRLIAVMESAAGTQERLIPLSAVLGLIKNSKTLIEAEEK